MTAEVIRFMGGPGTGKTHRLLDYIRQERDRGMDLKDFYFCSFTKSQRDDVRLRISEIYPDAEPQEIRRQVKTVHGLALTDCLKSGHIPEYSPTDNHIIVEGQNPGPFVEFCALYNIKYDPRLGIPEPGETPGKKDRVPPGNMIFSIARYIRQQYSWVPEDWMSAARELGYRLRSVQDVPGTIRAWEEYKKNKQLFEHDDYVDIAIKNRALPHVRMIFIDEFQDLTPAQHMLFRSWRDSSIKRIYIAGDPNQAIYGFRGADPAYLTQTRATDRGETPVSHRCPAEIVKIADEILHGRSYMKPKGPGGIVSKFEPKNAGDVTRSVKTLYQKYGEVLVISRFRKYVHQIARQLSAAGIPVTGLSPGKVYGWEIVRTKEGQKPADISVILKILRQVDDYSQNAKSWDIAPKAAVELIKASTLDEKRKCELIKNLKVRDSIFIEELSAAFGISPEDSHRPAAEIIRHLDFAEQILKNLTKALDNRIPPGAVRVDTIHAAKGLEAPGVIVDCRYLPGRREGYFRKNEEKEKMRAEERRVWYVAATRASEALYFMDYSNLQAPALKEVLAGV